MLKLEGLTENTLASLVMLVTLSVAFPVLETVNVLCRVLPTLTDPNAREVAESAMAGAGVEEPVPVVVTVETPPLAL